jgi:hypothetical protein
MDSKEETKLKSITFSEFKSVITTLDNITKLGYVNVSGSTYWLDSEEDLKALYKLYRDKQED